MIRGQERITSAHLERSAYVYVRQSSPKQVLCNLESQERQYELEGLVQSWGWRPERIVVVDEDLGSSADGMGERTGFTRLRAEVCSGRVGLVMSIETTRLARSNREWYHLLDLCAACETVVADPGGVYDPRDYEDRLHLGLKGILGEAELHIMKSRLIAGARHKAEKGELLMRLPVGLVADTDGRVSLDPDQLIQHTMRTLFEKFSELGSVRKVYRWMVENNAKMPHRTGSDLFSEVVWQPTTYNALLHIYNNPRYAGAYVHGRSEGYVRLENGEPRRRRRTVPIEKWHVVMPGAHVGYITWEMFLKNQERMKENYAGNGEGRGAPGRGPALLQGMVRCMCCAARMQVRYRRSEKRIETAYVCSRGTAQYLAGKCQSVNSNLVDHIVKDAFLHVLEPAHLSVSLEALSALEGASHAAERTWELKIDRCRYEIDRARRQYDQVEPENRLVAANLERRWEQRLQESKHIEEEFARWKQDKLSRTWNAQQIEELRSLVNDVSKLWHAETTTNEERKELLRLLIEDVWVRADRQERAIEVNILWKGGSKTVDRAAWWLNGRGVKEKVIRRVAELSAEGLLDTEIAERLNAEGYTRCDDAAFLQSNVTQIRSRKGINKAPPPRQADVYNVKEAAGKLGVSNQTIKNWLEAGLLQADFDRSRGEWKIKIAQEDEARVTGCWTREREWSISQAARCLGVPAWRVYKHIYAGEISARRAQFGRRGRLLIPADEVRRYAAGSKQFEVDVSKEV